MRRLQIKFPNQIRISGWDFDSSARAMNQAGEKVFTQAELVKVINSTTERKSMSTKTSIKRIALVAVSALGFGLLSVVPSNAAANVTTFSVDAADSISTGESATATLSLSFFAPVANDSVTVTGVVSGLASSHGGVSMAVSDSSTSGSFTTGNPGTVYKDGSANNVGAGAASTADYVTTITTDAATNSGKQINTDFAVLLTNVTVGGTYTVTFYAYTQTGVALKSTTWTVTVTAKSKVADGSSSSILREGEAAIGTQTTVDSVVVASKTATAGTTAAAATIYVNLRNADSAASESLTVTVSGPAYINADASTRETSVTAGTFAYDGANTDLYVWSTGTSGVATITIKTASGLTVGTETVTFYGTVTSIAVASDPAPKSIVRAGGYTSGTLFYLVAKDANGVSVPGRSFATTLTSASTVITSATVGSYDVDNDGYAVTATSAVGSVSGGKSTLTFRLDDPSTTDAASVDGKYLTVTKEISLGGSVATEVISLDKTSYEPGEGMIITITAKDSSGNPVYDGAASPALTATKVIGGAILGASTYTGGKVDTVSRKTDGTVLNNYTVYAPAAEGTFTIARTTTSSTITTTNASADVVGQGGAAIDAANEATDAANAATDAANAAAEAADAATAAAQDAQAAVAELATKVASLIAGIKAQITSLTNLVIKIQKKVKA